MFSLMKALGDALGQCKWLLFSRSQRPLSHLSHLDEASRGPYGSIKLFCTYSRYGTLPSLGALLTVATVAVNPFMQQIIHYRFIDVEQGAALLPVIHHHRSNGDPGYVAENLTMFSAASIAFVSPLSSTFNVTSFCPSGNCTWPAFQTLGICSHCTNLTDQIETGSVDASSDAFLEHFYSNETFEEERSYLPNGLYLPTGFYVNGSHRIHYTDSSLDSVNFNISTTSLMYQNLYPYDDTSRGFASNNLSVAYADRGSLIIDFLMMTQSFAGRFAAHECLLQYCVKNISAVQQNGQLVETEHDTWTNNSEAARQYPLAQQVIGTWSRPYLLQPPDQERVFSVRQPPQVELTTWLSGQLSRAGNGGGTNSNIMTQSIEGVLENNEAELPQLIANVADALTTAFRMRSNDTAPGVMYVNEAHIEIQWAWITLPLILFMLAVCFVGAVAWECGHAGDAPVNVWKNSLVAALFHGMDRDLLARTSLLNDQELIDEAAEELAVKLTRSADGLRLDGEETHELKSQQQWGGRGTP